MILASLMTGLVVMQAQAQVEYDDMYFRAKDRAQLREVQAEEKSNYEAFRKKHFPEAAPIIEPDNVNPTDSYSARSVNPEYISRLNSARIAEDDPNYFVEGYTPSYQLDVPANGYYANGFNNNRNHWNNPWAYSSFYGPQFGNGWHSPYYGYMDPWAAPMWGAQPGWSLSMNYGWNSWGSGWGYGLNYGNGFFNPYSPYFNNFWSPSWYYPTTVVVVDGNRASYGKYTSRGNVAQYNPNATTTTTGRTRTSTASRSNSRQAEYYNPRQRASTSYSSQYNSNTNTSNAGSRSVFDTNRSNSSFPSRSNSSYGNAPMSRPVISPTRSSGSNSGVGRSGSSTGRTRGGN